MTSTEYKEYKAWSASIETLACIKYTAASWFLQRVKFFVLIADAMYQNARSASPIDKPVRSHIAVLGAVRYRTHVHTMLTTRKYRKTSARCERIHSTDSTHCYHRYGGFCRDHPDNCDDYNTWKCRHSHIYIPCVQTGPSAIRCFMHAAC